MYSSYFHVCWYCKKDFLVSHLKTQLDAFRSNAGLSGIRAVDAAGNRMVVTAVYGDKQSANASSQKASGVWDSASQFFPKELFIREGEGAWRYVAEGAEDRPCMPSYARTLQSLATLPGSKQGDVNAPQPNHFIFVETDSNGKLRDLMQPFIGYCDLVITPVMDLP